MNKTPTNKSSKDKTEVNHPLVIRFLSFISSKDFFYCFLLFVISLILHLFHLRTLGVNNPLLLPLNPDSNLFDGIARHIAEGNIIREQPFFIGPLYSYFMALFYALFGYKITLIHYTQIVISATVPIFTYLIALKTFNRPTAVIGGLALALYPPLIFFDILLLPVALEVFLLSLSLLLLVGFPHKMSWRYGFAGITIGLVSLSRPNMLLFPLFLLFAALIYKTPKKLLHRLRWVVPLAVGAIIIILPITIHNYYLSGEFIPVSTHGGINFFVGNNPEATGAFHAPKDLSATPLELNWAESRRIAEEAMGKKLTPNQVSAYWFGEGFDFIRKNPTDFLRLVWRKAVLISNHYELGLNENFYFHRNQSLVLRLPLLNWGLLFAFGIIGLLVSLKRKGNTPVLFALILTTILTLLLFIVNDRYRLTMVVPLAIFGAYLPVWLVESFKRRRFLRAGLVTGGLICLLILCNINVFGLFPGKNFAPIHFRLGKYLLESGNYEQAAHHLNQVANLRPDDSNAHMLLGISYIKLNEPDKAYEKLMKACSLAPQDPKPFYNLSLLLVNYGHKEEAVPYLEHCFNIAPEYLPASFAYIGLLIELARLPQAEGAARELLEKDPQSENLNYRLGYILYLQEKDEQALDYLQSAGDFFDAHHIIGEIYLRAGMSPEALIELEKERELHPDNPLVYEPLNKLLNE